jgi:hypothetical protein
MAVPDAPSDAVRAAWLSARARRRQRDEFPRMREGHKWQFAARFRRGAFGWRSDTPIQRIKEAVAEIKKVSKLEPALAADGAVVLLEKLSPALEHVDSSSGAIGSAVNRAIDALVPIVAGASVDPQVRQRWLHRLWTAIEDDAVPYIEYLGECWDQLCVTPQIASAWADELLPTVESVWSPQAKGRGYAKSTTLCLAALYGAGRHEQLLDLLATAPYKFWHDRRWGVKALAAQGKNAQALRYAEESRDRNEPDWQISQVCESILLSSAMHEEAYSRYALEANQGTTNLATFRAIEKKYPQVPAQDILRDLVASRPGEDGKWFAAAKDAGLFDVAIGLVKNHPADPRTLARAARDYCTNQPGFAVASGLAALRWISLGYGYEITSGEVLDAYTAVIAAARELNLEEPVIKEQIRQTIAGTQSGSEFIKSVLAHRLSS